ncbi:PqqD family protein [Firmicutes bacterium OM04-13BH]|nr:PqqD family protein [Firmicutes bacterium AM10-47]RHV41351.1 PqqD family protein [Firmicutes bacterium OM04-13BH]
MKKNNNVISENYLERKPARPEGISWSADENGIVTLDIENTGAFNRIAQKLLKKPKVTHIHLDEIGSFVWPLLDGEKNIIELGKEVEKHFGEKANPLYERLAKYFQILDSYHFVEWK